MLRPDKLTKLPTAVPTAAAAAAAAAAAVSGRDETLSKMDTVTSTEHAVRGFGACWSLEKAYAELVKAGATQRPIIVEADAKCNAADFTVIGAREALAQGAECAVTTRATKKRSADGESTGSTLCGWVLL